MGKPNGNRIEDARGRVVEQLDPVILHVLHRDHVIEPEALAAIVDEIEPGKARIRRHTILLILGLLAAFAGFVGILYLSFDAGARQSLVQTLLNPAIMLPCFVSSVVVPWIAARQQRFKIVRFAMLKHRRCPHCGYDLRRTPPDPTDWATVCSECGCAWSIDESQLDAAIVTGRDDSFTPAARRRLWILLLLGLLVLGLALAAYQMG